MKLSPTAVGNNRRSRFGGRPCCKSLSGYWTALDQIDFRPSRMEHLSVASHCIFYHTRDRVMSFKSVQTYCAAVALLLGLSTATSSAAVAEASADATTAGDETAPYGDQQPLFDRLNVLEAWAITKGDPNVLVGVIDNGYDFYHPDLKGQLIPGFYFRGGYHTEFYSGMAHGTMMCSIVVAKDDNAGMVGLAPRCKVLTASQGMIEHVMMKMMAARNKFLREHPDATEAEIGRARDEFMKEHEEEIQRFARDWHRYQYTGAADAIRYLVNHDTKVINMSGLYLKAVTPAEEVWKSLEDAFSYAAEKDVVIVLSAGNDATRLEDYPGSLDSVIIAGATMLDDSRWEEEHEAMGRKIKQGSNYGNRLTVMAPVENLMVCQPHEERCCDVKDGPMGSRKVPFIGPHQMLPTGATSSAAPIVASLVALVLSVNPDLDAKSVVEIIKEGCDDIGEPGHDEYTGYGRVNFGKTVRLAVARQQQ